MSELIKHLKSFNRKERYWLLRETLQKDAFTLSPEFKKRLGAHIRTELPDKDADIFVAMDYHLDWLAVALHLAKHGFSSTAPIPEVIKKKDIHGGEKINSNQMDIDLLVAFEEENKTHIVLIEAKADNSWDNEQLEKKVDRLRKIFGNGDTPEDKDIAVYFILMSPAKSSGIKNWKAWPGWMRPKGKPHWMQLKGMRNTRPSKIYRSDTEGNESASGNSISWRPREWRDAQQDAVACDCEGAN